MNPGSALYFVAIVLPPDIAREVQKLQHYAADHFESSKALRSPPHITLVPPFFVHEERVELLKETMAIYWVRKRPVQVSLDSPGSFGNKVIFIEVQKTPVLEELSREMILLLHSEKFPVKIETRPYHPHVTIAFKDLKPSVFKEAFEYFRKIEFSATFETKRICLLKNSMAGWKVVQEFALS